MMEPPLILANGAFPEHPGLLALLKQARPRVCCDGAVNRLAALGLEPHVIVGDLDSIWPCYRIRFGDRLVADLDQETNDLTKAVRWCRDQGYRHLRILGTSGGREDHALANIALLARYNRDLRVDMMTDSGTFRVIHESTRFAAYPGQQVSIFAFTPGTVITSSGLRYPLRQRALRELWEGSLNEAEGMAFSLEFKEGELAVFGLHPEGQGIWTGDGEDCSCFRRS